MANNTILNRIFSRSTFSAILHTGNSPTYMQCVKRYVENPKSKTNIQLISEIYNILKTEYRNEYFYKNTIINQLLLERHDLKKTSVLTEIPISDSKVDIVMINGKANVYEIKTELDNFDKLNSQINNYYKAFDHVSVITVAENIRKIQKNTLFYDDVGIFILNKDALLMEHKKPKKKVDLLDKNTIFKILRKSEYESIILKAGFELPRVSDFNYYKECLKIFMGMKIEYIYKEYLKLLKKRAKIDIGLYLNFPEELKALGYFMNLKSKDYLMFNNFFEQKYIGGAR